MHYVSSFCVCLSLGRWTNVTEDALVPSLCTAGTNMTSKVTYLCCSLRISLQYYDILTPPCFCTSCAMFSWSWHCVECRSDGTGRTGTYILIDMVLNRMAKGEVSFFLSVRLCLYWGCLAVDSVSPQLNWVLHPHRREGDRYRRNVGACAGSETWHGSHQGC